MEPHEVAPTKLMPQSPSSVNTFETCPRQYAHRYIIKDLPYVETPQQREGNQFHRMAELRVKYKAELDKKYAELEPTFKVIDRWPNVEIEVRSAINKDGAPCEWRHRLIGGIIDLRAYFESRATAMVVDWKTGKPRDDHTQLMINAVTTFAEMPAAQYVTVAFCYTKTMELAQPITFSRASEANLKASINDKLRKIRVAHEHALFPPKPSGLCKGWCDVKDCEFNTGPKS